MSIDTRHFAPIRKASPATGSSAANDTYAFINRFIAEGKHKSALGTAKAYKNNKAADSYKDHDRQHD